MAWVLHLKNIVHVGSFVTIFHKTRLGQFPQDWENDQNVAFFRFFWRSAVTKLFAFFQIFSNVLKRFCPLHSKNVFALVLAHIKPELELFEIDDVGDDGNDDL